jgi:hypothetical protein
LIPLAATGQKKLIPGNFTHFTTTYQFGSNLFRETEPVPGEEEELDGANMAFAQGKWAEPALSCHPVNETHGKGFTKLSVSLVSTRVKSRMAGMFK